jgi:hypothetical protein
MKKHLAALGAALVLVGVAPAGSSIAATSPTPSAHASCVSARIVGQRKCIAAGQFCKHTARANRDYHKYGYHCGKRDARGNYHLVYY